GRMVPVFRWVADPINAEVVRAIFQWYADGRSPGWIAAELDRRGVPPPRSTHRDKDGQLHWRRCSIRELLANPIYIGERAWGKTAVGCFHRLGPAGKIIEGTGKRIVERRPRAEWFVVDKEEDIPALICRDLWDTVQRRLCREKDTVDENGRRHR